MNDICYICTMSLRVATRDNSDVYKISCDACGGYNITYQATHSFYDSNTWKKELDTLGNK